MLDSRKLDDLTKVKIRVCGDAMLDQYIQGAVSRISPEAPIPILNYDFERNVLGGAANVVRNLCDFGAQVELVSVYGYESHETVVLRDLLAENIEIDRLVEDISRPTTTKTRVLGNGQQIVRIDKEVSTVVSDEVSGEIVKQLKRGETEGVIVADYAKGVVTQEVVSCLRELSQSGVMVAVDPHPNNLQDWSGVSLLKPNLGELQLMSGVKVNLVSGECPIENQSFLSAVAVLYQRYETPHLLVTLSEHGMVYVYENEQYYWEPARSEEVFDVSGAGDTVISYFMMALIAGWPGQDAMRLANVAAGLVVRKLGTASLSLSEIKQGVALMSSELF